MSSQLLSQISDQLEITDVLNRYSRALDGRDWALLESVFTPDAVVEYGEYGSTNIGPVEVGEHCAGGLEGLDCNQHLLSNIAVEINGDEATSRCYLHAQHVFAGAPGGDFYFLGGGYEDDLVRTDDGWRIKHRRLTVLWADGNPDVFMHGVERLSTQGPEKAKLAQGWRDRTPIPDRAG
jgi:hypothetical protein